MLFFFFLYAMPRHIAPRRHVSVAAMPALTLLLLLMSLLLRHAAMPYYADAAIIRYASYAAICCRRCLFRYAADAAAMLFTAAATADAIIALPPCHAIAATIDSFHDTPLL